MHVTGHSAEGEEAGRGRGSDTTITLHKQTVRSPSALGQKWIIEEGQLNNSPVPSKIKLDNITGIKQSKKAF